MFYFLKDIEIRAKVCCSSELTLSTLLRAEGVHLPEIELGNFAVLLFCSLQRFILWCKLFTVQCKLLWVSADNKVS